MLEKICVTEEASAWGIACDVVLNVSSSRDLLRFFPELWFWLMTSIMSTTCFGTILDELSFTDLVELHTDLVEFDIEVRPCLSSFTDVLQPCDLDLPLKKGILPQTFSKWFSHPHLWQTLPIAGQSDLFACLSQPHPKHWLWLSFPWLPWHECDWDLCLWASDLFCVELVLLLCVPDFFLPWWHFLK